MSSLALYFIHNYVHCLYITSTLFVYSITTYPLSHSSHSKLHLLTFIFICIILVKWLQQTNHPVCMHYVNSLALHLHELWFPLNITQYNTVASHSKNINLISTLWLKLAPFIHIPPEHANNFLVVDWVFGQDRFCWPTLWKNGKKLQTGLKG